MEKDRATVTMETNLFPFDFSHARQSARRLEKNLALLPFSHLLTSRAKGPRKGRRERGAFDRRYKERKAVGKTVILGPELEEKGRTAKDRTEGRVFTTNKVS